MELPLISILVVNYDYYMLPLNYSLHDENQSIEVSDSPLPIIRIFGSTNYGQRAVLHVHGYFPYLYFRPVNVNDRSFESVELVETYITQMKMKIEEELNKDSNYKSNKIHRINVEKHLSMYGYHQNPQVFVKVTMRDPSDIKKLVGLLENGIFGVMMQTYESHIPYLLKFTTDACIEPMSWLDLPRHTKFRVPLPSDDSLFPPCTQNKNFDLTKSLISNSDTNSQYNVNETDLFFTPNSTAGTSTRILFSSPVVNKMTELDPLNINSVKSDCNNRHDSPSQRLSKSNIPIENIWDESSSNYVKKTSTCELELDIHYSQIDKVVKTTFGTELWDEEKDRRQKRGLEFQRLTTPPFSRLDMRSKYGTDHDFAIRLGNLYDKVHAIYKISKSKPEYCQSQLVLSQHLNDHILSSIEPSKNSNKFESWAEGIFEKCLDASEFNMDASFSLELIPDLTHENIHNIQNDNDEVVDTLHQSCLNILSQDEVDEIANILSFTQQDDLITHTNNPEVSEVKIINESHNTLSKRNLDDQKPNTSKRLSLADVLYSKSTRSDLKKRVRFHSHSSSQIDKNIFASQTSLSQGNEVVQLDQNRFNKNLLLQLNDMSPPIAENLRPLSDFGISHLMSSLVVVSDKKDLIGPKVNGLNASKSKLSVLESRKKLLVHSNDCLEFDGGVTYSGILIPQEKASMINDSSKPFPSIQQKTNKYISSSSDDEDIDDWVEEVDTSSRNFDQSHVSHGNHVSTLVNISEIDLKILRMNYSGALERVMMKMNNNSLRRKNALFLFPTFPSPRLSDVFIQQETSLMKTSNSLQSKFTSQIETPKATNSSVETKQMKLSPMNLNKSTKKSRLTIFSCEICCQTRGSNNPNPKIDPVLMISWCVDDIIRDAEQEECKRLHGIIATYPITIDNLEKSDPIRSFRNYGLKSKTTIELVPSEKELLLAFVNTISTIDPDIIIGYEIQKSSLGYLISRGNQLELDLLRLTSRIPSEKPSSRNVYDKYSLEHESGIFITGRIVLNVWRRMRSELKLMSYTRESVAASVLHSRIPHYELEILTKWYLQDHTSRAYCIQHLQCHSELNLQLFDKLDLLRRISESARLYGIDFFSVISRGSQYRVEASLLKKAKVLGYLALSPSKHQVANQCAMAVIPLVMEPFSSLYVDPVIVLDFQSLYPSMIIAYNLCYSTCMGKLLPGTIGLSDTSNKLGVIEYPETNVLLGLQGNLPSKPFIAPNGTMFSTKETRLGILPQMLREILDTRLMVKQAMNTYNSPEDTILRRNLEARQLAIKLLANVTYGYTAAGFSGRMPMSELADAIVACGRSTLLWTIEEIEKHKQWNARVVYGDTDSVFVQLVGRSREEAFHIGKEIAYFITSTSPSEVVLKFEKVYHPCILVTKKRYVGNSFETLEACKKDISHLDVKGLEMIRRDQCRLTQKLQEGVIRILFKTKDISQVKSYLIREWTKIRQGGDKLTIQDFIFTKEVKYGNYSHHSKPPGAIIIDKACEKDEMAIPPYRWKVPYVVISGNPYATLRDLVISPQELLRRGNHLNLNIKYYLEKVINPSLIRILSLCGIDVNYWYLTMSKPIIRYRQIEYDLSNANANSNSNSIINRHIHEGGISSLKQKQITSYITSTCQLCSNDTSIKKSLCYECREKNIMQSYLLIQHQLHVIEQKNHDLSFICSQCSHKYQSSILFQKLMIGKDTCSSIDCKVFFERCRTITRLEDLYITMNEIQLN